MNIHQEPACTAARSSASQSSLRLAQEEWESSFRRFAYASFKNLLWNWAFFFSLKGLDQISSGLTLYIFHKGQLFVFFLFPRLSWVFLFLLPLLAGVAFCERGTHGSEI